MRTFLVGIVVCSACTPTPSSTTAMPWLRGLAATASSDVLASGVPDRMSPWQPCDDPCTDYGGIELVADVAPGEGTETILASYSQGIVVLDHAGHLLARGGGFDATGSADELLAVVVGDAMLDTPVIAVSARVGGRRENEVWLELYRVTDQKLERLFAAVVEEHDDHADKIGSVMLVPAALVYKAPRATTPDSWIFDRRAGRYLYRGTVAPEPKRPTGDLIVRERDPR